MSNIRRLDPKMLEDIPLWSSWRNISGRFRQKESLCLVRVSPAIPCPYADINPAQVYGSIEPPVFTGC